jgi:PAS domain S-box-containing protein
MSRLRHSDELLLTSANAIREALGLSDTAVSPVPALIAIPLHSHDRFQGVLWLGYRQPHRFGQTEQDLLKTLAGQAAVLVENARLFATAEGGRRRLAAVLASTSDAVIVTDQTNRVLLVNRAMERIFDLRANRVIGRPLADVIKAKELIAALSGTESRARNLEIPTEDEKTYYASVSNIYNNEGQEMGRVAVLHDITPLKEIDKMKSSFVQTITHDLKGPLSVMSGHTTLLTMTGEINKEQQASLDKIRSSIDKMANMVDAMLHLGRIEAGIPLNYEAIDVPTLLSEIASEYWPHAHQAKLEINIDAPADLPRVLADRQLIQRAIVNLLINACNHAPDTGSVQIKAELANGEMLFSVRDHGPGISEEHQMRIFEKFYRVQKRGEKKKGTGLGLAMVKSTAERHGGRAWLRSKEGRGSAFYFSIPLQPPNQNGSNQ